MDKTSGKGFRILITMPHFCKPDEEEGNKRREIRSMSLVRSVSSFVQQAGGSQFALDFIDKSTKYVNLAAQQRCDLFICTTGDNHLLGELEILKGLYNHVKTDAQPMLLGYTCREILKSFLGKYDFYCYVEDDLFLNDPLFFQKLAWFSHESGNGCLLQPNRCETSFSPYAKKCYIDGDIPPENNPHFHYDLRPLSLSSLGRDFLFTPATNPHSGCFFLNAEQFEHWVRQPHFNDWDISWLGPLESAASLAMMKSFATYKPAWENANFLEINHFGDAYLQMIGEEFEPSVQSPLSCLNPLQLEPLTMKPGGECT